jgi:hypothetical protein
MSVPEVVGPRNERKHLQRLLERRLHKEHLRWSDRRRNFEAGESVGLLLGIGSIAIVLGWNGGIISTQLETWQRISIAAMGAVLMVVQHSMRRNFYKRIESPLIGARKKKEHVDDSGS